MDFSETIEACDLKVVRCRQLIELIKVLKVKVIFLPWPQGIYIWKLKLVFLRNYWAIFNQILYVSFQVQGNENQWTWCWSHDQDGGQAHIWLKPFKNLLRNWWTDFCQTWYVALGTPAHHCLFKWWPWIDLDLFYGKVKFGNLSFSTGKIENSGFYRNHWSLWPGKLVDAYN